MTLRLFVDGPLHADAEFALGAGAARHAQVRRVQPGDALRLFDGSGGEWAAEVSAMTRSAVRVRLLHRVAIDLELPQAVTLAVGMPAGERMDWLVEKATELGAASIQPLLCERSVLRVQGERAERKREHWQAIAIAAAEQCGRTHVPKIAAVALFDDFVRLGAGAAARWMLSLRADATLPSPAQREGVMVVLSGPEGGLSEAEETLALAQHWRPLTLGPRVLRAETAPLALLAWVGLVPQGDSATP